MHSLENPIGGGGGGGGGAPPGPPGACVSACVVKVKRVCV